MTHPATPEVGGEDTAPANDPFENIAAEMLGEDEQEEEEEQPEADESEDAPEPEEVDELDEVEEEELPPIDPPNSLTAEEKELFKGLPREAQEFTSRRIGELEKGFQSKAQEAAQAKQNAATEAAQYLAQLETNYATELDSYAQQLTVQKPNPALIATDPVLYAQQSEHYEYWTAQRADAQRKAQEARSRAEQNEQFARQQQEAADVELLRREIPEFFDEISGPKLKEELVATAKHLGLSDADIDAARGAQIIALKKITELKADADKYRTLMKKQMERVRAGKAPPPIAKPGTPRGAAQNRKAQADAAWQGALTARTRNQRDAAIATWAEKSGWLD